LDNQADTEAKVLQDIGCSHAHWQVHPA